MCSWSIDNKFLGHRQTAPPTSHVFLAGQVAHNVDILGVVFTTVVCKQGHKTRKKEATIEFWKFKCFIHLIDSDATRIEC